MQPAKLLSVLLACLFVSGCSAPAPEVEEASIDLSFQSYSLANGMDVILRKDDRVPVAAVNIWYDVSPADEPAGKSGLAHLFEHMMLQGSGHAPGDYFTRLEAAGATGVNGNTDFDRTAFLEDVPSDQLELALWAESDRMGFLLDSLDEQTLENQKSVVRNERRQVVDDAPYGLAQEEVYRRLFPEEHPYHNYILGSHQDIQGISLDDVRSFYNRYYAPNNASLSITGNIDLERTMSLIEKYFGPLPAAPEIDEPAIPVPQIDEQIRVQMTDQVELPRLYMGWVTPPAFQIGDAEAVLAARMLGGGKASRLYGRLVYDKKIAQSVTASQRSLAHGSVFQITATAKPGHTVQELEQAIRETLDELVTLGPGVEELEATKTATAAIALKSLEPFAGVADRLNAYNHFLSKPGYLNEDLQRYERVADSDIERFIAGALAEEKAVVIEVTPGEKQLSLDPDSIVVDPTFDAESGAAESPESPESVSELPPPDSGAGPEGSSESATPDRPEIEPASPHDWRFEVPQPGPAPDFELPAAQSFELDNGLQVHLVENHELPLYTAQLTARSGSASDPVGQPGITSFATAMMNEGTPDRSALQIANELTAQGSSLATGSSKEGSWVILRGLTGHIESSMPIMADVVTSPTFPEDEIERVRDDRLVAHRQQADRPLTTAFGTMWHELYGADHPYGHLNLGSAEVIQSATRRDLMEAYRRTFGPNNAGLFLAGDIDVETARQLAERYFGDWDQVASAPQDPGPGNPGTDRLLLVDRPDAAQTTLVVAQPGVARLDPAYEPLQLMNQVLGRLFSSRLNQSLRETLGVTYGVTSELTQTRGIGTLDIYTSVDAPATGAAVGQILAEVRNLKKIPITEDELAEAKISTVRTLPAQFMTNGSIASTYAHLYVLGLPLDYFQGLGPRLDAITLDEVHQAADVLVRPDEMKVIAVGDLATIEPQLLALGLNPVGVRDAAEDGPIQQLAASY